MKQLVTRPLRAKSSRPLHAKLCGLIALALFGAALALSAAPTVPAHSRTALSTSGLQIQPGSGVRIELASYYNSIPPTGYLPVQVTIQNDSRSPHTWRFEFDTESGHNSKVRSIYVRHLAVDAGDKRVFELLVPTQAAFRNQHSYGNLQMKVKVSGYGVIAGDCFQSSYDGWGSNQTPYLAMGTELAVRSWGLMEEEGRKKSNFIRGTSVEPGMMSSDWRGYAGIECLWLTDEEWRKLSPEARAAALDWIAQGGELTLFARVIPPEGLGAPELEKMGPGGGTHGFGKVTVRMWDGKVLNAQEGLEWLKGVSDSLPAQAIGGYRQPWTMLDAVGETTVNTIFYLAFVISFALLIGPTNLFLFARGNNRHRLFWTTPLISIAASAILSGAIVLKDGFGGSGVRMAVCRLFPEDREALIIQEQVSKTGVMLNRRFDPQERYFMAPVDFEGEQAGQGSEYIQEEDTHAGDWFRTRATQGHLLEAMRPTRWRVERVSDGAESAPVLVSTIGATMRDLYYFDEQSVVWKGANVRAGERVELRPATKDEFDRWWTGISDGGGARIKFAMKAGRAKPGWFYGVAEKPKDVLLETSSDIEWKKNTVAFMGPCSAVEAQQHAETPEPSP